MSFERVLINVFKDEGIISSQCKIPGVEVLEKVRSGMNPCEECEKKKECGKNAKR